MMMRVLAGLTLCVLLSGPARGQSTATPAAGAAAQSPVASASTPPEFEAAEIHSSRHHAFPFADGGSLHGDRYTLRQATMLDLISKAYGLDPSNVQGGPAWLEQDRFDITARASAQTSQAGLKLMLRSLLADRFKLVTHTGSAPMPAYVLTVAQGGKPKLKESDGTSEPGCIPQPPEKNQPAGTIPYIVVNCHSMSMETFAEMLHMMASGYLTNPVVDATGLKGSWDFDIKWTGRVQQQKAGADGISIFDAVEKQLGLKLELKTAPRPVLIVDSVMQQPTPNPPGIEKILPPPPPAQFEVATIKPAQPDAQLNGRINGGQINLQGVTLKFLISFAWESNPNDTEVPSGAPKWLDVDKFDILAKASNDSIANTGPTRPPIDIEDLREMLRGLLVERFQMKTHIADMPISAYTLTAATPKLRKADPLSRTRCTEGPGPDGKDPRTTNPILNRLVTCQNMTMAQIGDEFQRIASGFIYGPVLDATGIKGSWDFTLSFSSADLVKAGPDTPNGDGSTASEPNGAVSFFTAVNKQLGLKLEKQKRPVPVLVIDHIEETPTEN